MVSGDGEHAWEEDEVLTGSPKTPDITMGDDDVEGTDFEYTDRHPTDWVISGPMGDNFEDRGRYFRGWDAAETWARAFYGERFLRRVPEAKVGKRWAFLIKGAR